MNLVDIWNFWEAAGRAIATANGGTIYAPSAEFEAELQEVYAAVAERWIAETGGEAQAVYDAAVALVEQYS